MNALFFSYVYAYGFSLQDCVIGYKMCMASDSGLRRVMDFSVV